ncbi:hypothetical protein E2C01_039489 [Portunus trituberculatus]|uniref:Nucleic-acid-binding protein from transposon X-element n=1 Tax=Portunus trituberculatus TaxID=210409 RepID=A0A5B7FN65_PORTR|nr:hypothetical protein [Portunus trituberculatus]
MGLDELVYGHSAEEIAAEVGAQHKWAKAECVFKFPRSFTAKITFTDAQMARNALLEGLNLFQIHVPGHQMRQEVFIPLVTCNRYNVVEKHPTSSCPHPAGYMRCSECSSEEHSYRNCTTFTKKCLNCGGDHSATAMWCPVRKEALKKKEEATRQARVRPNVSFAQATQQASPTADPVVTDPSKALARLMCLIHARIINASHPGSFQKTLSMSLAENGLPDVKLPTPSPLRVPEEIFQAVSEGIGKAITIGETDDSESEEDSHETKEVRFGFLAKHPKRRKLPTTGTELNQLLRNKSLILSHTSPPQAEQIILDHVKDNLASLHSWILPSSKDYEQAKNDPKQILRDALRGRYSLACE